MTLDCSKPDRGRVKLNSEECKGCGLCGLPRILRISDHSGERNNGSGGALHAASGWCVLTG